MNINNLFDEYALKARLYPALIALLPLFITFFFLFPILTDRIHKALPILIGCGVLYLFTHIVRFMGRSKERYLFSKWGGMPSNIMLRHNDNTLDINTKTRYRDKLTKLTNVGLPSKLEEEIDLSVADDAYGSAGTWLRENTRDKSKYTLLFKENVSYGFRRNTYGIKYLGVAISLVSIGICIAIGIFKYENTNILISVASAALFAFIFLLFWILLANEKWVRDAAYSYANQLLSSLDNL